MKTIQKLLASGVALFSASSAVAQTSAGSLTYTPSLVGLPGGAAVEAVPLPGILLVIIGASLLLLGVRALRKYGRRHCLGLLLAVCGTATVFASGTYIQRAVAVAAIINLGNSAGDTIELPTGGFELLNTSGAELVIDSINVASDCSSNAPAGECLAGTVLAPLESCFTDFQCTPAVVDSDGDGFLDNVDACPAQGDQGFGVDGFGCPNPP
ncbi:midcut-by-XrtH protein [Haliea sp. E17]|uniref:midcut-by-XrtH protein n=1 Tax=Haliea sp. E17 TaxID=3401576 RepID=UPI003AADBF92